MPNDKSAAPDQSQGNQTGTAAPVKRHLPIGGPADAPDDVGSISPPAKGMVSGPRTPVPDREAAEGAGGTTLMPGQRETFVLSRDGQTPVFADGGTGNREAIAVFSNREHAVLYLQVARWDDYKLESLSPRQLAGLLQGIRGQGVQHAMVNPNRREQERGVEQPLLHLERTPDMSGENLYEEVQDIGARRGASTHV